MLRPHRRLPALLTLLTLGMLAVLVAPPDSPAQADVVADGAAASSTTVPFAGGTATATVAQTTDLFNQTVRVTWQGLEPTPDDGSGLTTVTEDTTGTVYVAQCWGADPAGPEQCYGVRNRIWTLVGGPDDGPDERFYTARSGEVYGADNVVPDGPGNAVTAATRPDGTGEARIEVRDAIDSPTLGCTDTDACSLVVLPMYSENGPGQVGQDAGSRESWARRAVVPLHFAPTTAGACGLSSTDVETAGSPNLSRAMASWIPAACRASSRVVTAYSDQGEGEARTAYAAGRLDAALTTRPLPDGTATARQTVYAPVADTGIAVAFVVDDPLAGSQLRAMKLSARLVAKLVTQSYDLGTGSRAPYGNEPEGAPATVPNTATAGNAPDLFDDPEFLELNPGTSWPFYAYFVHPQLFIENSDIAWELTRWLATDPVSKAFLAGAPDPSGMTVNAHFRDVVFPTESLPLNDPHPLWQEFYQPARLAQVSKNLVRGQDTALVDFSPANGFVGKPGPPQIIGQRALLGFVDLASAEAYDLPVAALQNAAGQYVTPDAASMRAAVDVMTTTPAGTQQADHTAAASGAYPLTMVDYLAAPSTGLSATKAGKLADLLLSATSRAGQTPGRAVGSLAVGYAPLTTAQTAWAAQAAGVVRAQQGRPTPAPAPTVTATVTATASGAATAPGSGGPAAPDSASTGGSGGSSRSGNGSGGTSSYGSTTSATSSRPGATDATTPTAASAPAAAVPTPAPSTTTTALTVGAAVDRTPRSAVSRALTWSLPALLGLGLLTALLGPLLALKGRRRLPRWPAVLRRR